MTKYGISTDPSERMKLGSSSKPDGFAAAKFDDTNKVSDHSVRKTSIIIIIIIGRLLEVDVQPNFVTQLSGHKNLSYHSEATAKNACYPEP